jgi:lysophospholipase L1-like esterase
MREFKQYLLSLLILTALVSGFVFLRFAHDYPFPVGPQFDPHVRQRYREMLNQDDPQILVFGDSIVESNVDATQMTNQLRERVSAISEPGAGSALLYLVLKNNIVEAQSKPDVLILVFRDTVLTSPGFRVYGNFFNIMDEYAGADDDLVLQRAIRNQMSPVEKVAEAYFPPYWGRWDLRALIVSKVIDLPMRLLFRCSQKCYETSMGDVFGNQNFEPDQLNEAINSAENYLYTDENLDFKKQIDRSFLPEIVRICRENHIQLILVRTKTLRFSRERPEPAALVQYIHDLNNYARENGIPLIDFAHDDRLDPGLYKDLHHLTEDGKKVFTEMLVEALKSVPAP